MAFAVLACLLLAAIPAYAVGPLATAPTGMDLYILAGQSNMVGQDAVPASAPTDARVFTFALDNQWHQGQESTHDRSFGVVDTYNASTSYGYGAGEGFGIGMANGTGHNVGLIPCGIDGTSILDWQRNLALSSPYGICLHRAREAMDRGTIRGLVFYQGEDEAIFPAGIDTPAIWAAAFTAMVTDWRLDLGNPSLPVVFVQIASTGQPGVPAEQSAQASVVMPGVAMVTAADLAFLSDNEHLTAAGQDTLAGRLSGTMCGLVTCTSPTPTPTPTNTPTPTPTPSGGLSVSPTSVAHGGTITVSWSGLSAATTHSWFNLVLASDPVDQDGINWEYMNSCTFTAGSTAATSGSCSFTVPSSAAAGAYQIRAMKDDNYADGHIATAAGLTVT